MPARVLAAQLGLRDAWERVRANGGMAGADGATVMKFSRAWAANLRAIEAALAGGTYHPLPLRVCEVPKKAGSSRLLLVPAVADRVVQSAAGQWIGRKFERQADPASYAYRPGRGVADALRALRSLRDQGYRWVLDADIRGFYDNIDHAVLLDGLREWLGAGSPLLGWIGQWLPGPVWDGTGLYRVERGVAQGSPISPVLANFYLDTMDRGLRRERIRFIRYADDFLVLARSPFDLNELRERVGLSLGGLKLELNDEKTRMTSFGNEFRFLGAEVRDESILLPFEKPRPEKKALFLAPPMPPAMLALYRRKHWSEFPPFHWSPRPVEVATVKGGGDPKLYDALRRAHR